MTCPREAPCERHREARGVSRRDQLLRIRPRALLEARAERVRALIRSASETDASLTAAQIALPNRIACPDRHVLFFRFLDGCLHQPLVRLEKSHRLFFAAAPLTLAALIPPRQRRQRHTNRFRAPVRREAEGG